MESEVWETWPKDVVHALIWCMMDADRKFGADNEAGTKTFIREYLIPEMERAGLTVLLHGNANSRDVETKEEK